MRKTKMGMPPVVNDNGTSCRCFQPGEHCLPNCKRRKIRLKGLPIVENIPKMPPVKPPKSEEIEYPECFCGLTIRSKHLTGWFCFNLGNVIKYVWRARQFPLTTDDLKKAKYYIELEIKRRETKMP